MTASYSFIFPYIFSPGPPPIGMDPEMLGVLQDKLGFRARVKFFRTFNELVRKCYVLYIVNAFAVFAAAAFVALVVVVVFVVAATFVVIAIMSLLLFLLLLLLMLSLSLLLFLFLDYYCYRFCCCNSR